MLPSLHNQAEMPHAPFVPDEIETTRLHLRMFTPDDLEDLCHVVSNPEVTRFIGNGKPLAREDVHFNLTSIINGFRRRGYGRWAVVKKESGALVGYCGLSLGNEEVGVEIAYLLARDEWGKGIATEAARASLRYGFERLNLDSIAALTRHKNLRSRHVMERLGMRYMRDAKYYGYNCICYSISRADWRADGSIYRVTR